jgi:hypothetical protein
LWGIGLHEWKGVSLRTKCLVAASLVVLIGSTVVVGYGNYVGAARANSQALFENPTPRTDSTLFHNLRAPLVMPAAHIFKIRGGKIHEIEAMGFTMPYNSKTGWE